MGDVRRVAVAGVPEWEVDRELLRDVDRLRVMLNVLVGEESLTENVSLLVVVGE